MAELQSLTSGMPIVFGGNQVTTVPEALANAFSPGDHLIVVQTTGDLLHVPADVAAIAHNAVGAAVDAFGQMGSVSDAAISNFFERFAQRLEDEASFAPIAAANVADIEAAKAKGRSTTRLELTATMREDMISGLRGWATQPSGRGDAVDTVEHDGWTIEQVRSGLGVVGFVFEGRPKACTHSSVSRSWLARWCGEPCCQRLTSCRARNVQRRPAIARCRQGEWCCRGPIGRRRSPSRRVGQPPRHRRGVDGGIGER